MDDRGNNEICFRQIESPHVKLKSENVALHGQCRLSSRQPVGNAFKHQDLLPPTKHHFSIATSGLGDHKELQAPLSPVFLEVRYFKDG